MKLARAISVAALGLSVLGALAPGNASAQPTDEDDPAAAPGAEGGAEDGGAEGEGEGEPTKQEMLQRIEELEDIVAELERKSVLQRISWSADYRLTLSSYHYEGESPDGARNPDGTPRKVELDNLEQWTHRARLSLQADPTAKLRFRARLAVFKRFGDNSFGPVLESSTGRVPRDVTARFDRFWVDWFLSERWSVSLGRISTTDGSPSELRENLDRPASTLSLDLVDREYDAVAVTYQVGRLLVRGFYLPWQFQRSDDLYGTLPFLARDTQPMRTFGAALQYRSSTPSVPNFDLTAFLSPRFRALPPLDLPVNGELVAPSKVPSSLGLVGGATALLLWREMVRGLDAFVAGSFSYVDPNDSAVEYPLGPDGASIPVLTLTSADSDSHVGLQVYTGLRLTMPFGGKRAPKC